MGCIPSQYIQHFNFRFIIILYFLLGFRFTITHFTTLTAILNNLVGVLFVKVISYQVQSVGYRHAISRIYA